MPYASIAVFFASLMTLCAHAADPQALLEAPEITVDAKSLKTHEVSFTPCRASIEQPATDVSLAETLEKLPGVFVNNTSGFGSSTTVIASQALGSTGTAVSFDDMPILDPSGLGINFSLFPSSLLSSIEHLSAFYPSIDPSADISPAPGGRINLLSLKAPHAGESPWMGSLLLGTAHTLQAAVAYRGGDEKRAWALGISGYNTAGNYHFKDPSSGSSKNRANNDASGEGALAKIELHPRPSSTLEAFGFISNGDRTNPGPLTSPSRDHEKDFLGILGISYKDPRAISSQDGLFAKTSASFSRIGIRSTPPFDSYDIRAMGHYGQLGYARRHEKTTLALALDNQYETLRNNDGFFNQDVFGVNGTLSLEEGPFRIVPRARYNVSDRFPNAGDGSITSIYSIDSNTEISASYGLSHMNPPIIASSGYRGNGGILLPNPTLDAQRDSVTSISFIRRHQHYSMFATAFYDLVRNRATFQSVSQAESRYISSPAVSIEGGALDFQLFLFSPISIRSSISLSRAWDRSTGHEMPYKPRIEGLESASWALTPRLALTAQEQFMSARFVSTTGVETLSPFAQTHLRVDAQAWDGLVFLKVSNLFDAAGFQSPDFPFTGRSFWIGYTLGQTML